MVFIVIFFIILFLVDMYVFQAVRTVTDSRSLLSRKLIYFFYWGLTALTFVSILLAFYNRGTSPSNLRTALLIVMLILFVSKLVVVAFLLLDDGARLVKLLAHQLFKGPGDKFSLQGVHISRNKFLNQLALLAGSLPFVTMVWGMAKGAYSYRVRRVTLQVPHLPKAFDGYRLLHISDLHTGSFRSTSPLFKAVELINQQQADLVLFTGDLVNYISTEVLAHMPALRQIKARTAIYSILGNHDYGDYVDWKNREAKEENFQNLKEAHRQLGWNLLLNENRIIEKDGEKIAVIGVENWSAKRNFPKYGNLEQAFAGTQGTPFKILLSHDPSHWDGQVNTEFPDIDLTLSGHTHGMQFGVNLPGFKWSPVQYVYDQWAGLYQKGQQYLYVNTGLGFLGYPGRVGFLPEISVIELRKA
jgi:uncharacterized protein